MKNTIKFIISILICLTPTGVYAAKRYMEIEPTYGQIKKYKNGNTVIESHAKTNSVAIISNDEVIKKRGYIELIILNSSNSSVDFDPKEIDAFTEKGVKVEIVPYEKLLKEEKNRQKWDAIITGLAAVGNNIEASNAGNISGSANYQGNTYGQFGGLNFNTRSSGVINYSEYNSSEAARARSNANAENRIMQSEIRENNKIKMEKLNENVRITTVEPDGFYGGKVVFQVPKMKTKTNIPMNFKIKVGEEIHTFYIELKNK
jgi:hypothetical protein